VIKKNSSKFAKSGQLNYELLGKLAGLENWSKNLQN